MFLQQPTTMVERFLDILQQGFNDFETVGNDDIERFQKECQNIV